jgi:hypothetical protein
MMINIRERVYIEKESRGDCIEGRGNTQKTTELLLEAGEQELLRTWEDPMDEQCKQDSKDSIRRTIVKHGKVFRQQVRSKQHHNL